jgi:hypothetical protein
MTLWRFFVRKENIELRDEKTQDRTLKEAVYGRKPRKSKVWLSPPREKGGVTAKKPIWVWGALLEKGREG